MSTESVCLCDDDNDIEMAMATQQAYIPALTSQSMTATIQRYPTKFTVTFQKGVTESTMATDAALELIHERVVVDPANKNHQQ